MGTGDCFAAFRHSEALLRMLIMIPEPLQESMMAVMPLLSRLAAEVSLVGASTLGLFEERVVFNLTTPQRKKLAAFYHIGTDCSGPTLPSSPMLQGQEESFFILLRLTELSRMHPSSAATIELEELENDLSPWIIGIKRAIMLDWLILLLRGQSYGV